MRRSTKLFALAALAALALPPGALRADDLDELQEKAIQEAVKKIAPSVVKIETSAFVGCMFMSPTITVLGT